MQKKKIGLIILGLVITGAVLWGPVVSRVEQAKYTVVESQDSLEIRDYAPKIVAQTEISGPRKDAIGQGFRIIADYIFGNNTSSEKVAMTAPVMQKTSETISMTAPVMQQGSDNLWKVEFVMPSHYTMETLPKPNHDAVKLIQVPGKRFAVIRFSGFAAEETLKEQTRALNDYVQVQNLKAVSTPVYAFYNPPWTLPFLRRNEVMIEVSKE